MNYDSFVGVWLLERAQIIFSNARTPLEPFGPSPQGMLIYTANGHMQALLSHQQRTPLSNSYLEGAHRSSPTEKAAAFDEYLSYGGRAHIENAQMVHTVEYALHPNIVGQQQHRNVQWLTDDQLLLYYTIETSSSERTYKLFWRRAP